ncbi:MAG: MAPEG family protein [Azospirillum sp.]|nr:MAPEG family protein [Azospirillum sp.]
MTLTTPLTALVTALALIQYFLVSAKVGWARGHYKVPAPAIDGPPEFARIVRVQANTVEQLVLFLPALWLFALSVGDRWAAGLGLLWVVGRVIYAAGYYAAAEKRHLGFLLSIVPCAVMVVGSAIAVLMSL